MSMERLTERNKSNCAMAACCGKACEYNYCCEVGGFSECKGMDDIIDRLADLEDILGDTYDLDRLRELVEADKTGRCAIFPCRPSDVTVYQLRNKKHARGIGVHPRHIHCATVWADGRYQFEHQGMEPCKGKDLGKTWFLTKETAEAALAKEEGQCDVK